VKRLVLAWGPAVVWALVLFSLSELRDVPPALEPLAVIPPLLAHVIVYAALGVTLAWGRLVSEGRWAGSDPRGSADGHKASDAPVAPPRHSLLLALGYLYGALDEWHQSFVPGRTPSVTDWVADMVGVTLGYALALLVAGAVLGGGRDETGQTRRPPAGGFS
jgi:VanZ family protein